MRNSWNRKGWRPLSAALGVSALALLSGCDWFGGSTPADLLKMRPGADKDVPVSAVLPPPPSGQQYGPPVVPVDEARGGSQIGSVVAASGGQKAQIEKQQKDELAQEQRERASREKAAREAKEAEKNAAPGKQASTSGDKPGEPPTQPVAPPREAVTGTPVPPPAADSAPATPPANPPAVPPADAKPAGS